MLCVGFSLWLVVEDILGDVNMLRRESIVYVEW